MINTVADRMDWCHEMTDYTNTIHNKHQSIADTQAYNTQSYYMVPKPKSNTAWYRQNIKKIAAILFQNRTLRLNKIKENNFHLEKLLSTILVSLKFQSIERNKLIPSSCWQRKSNCEADECRKEQQKYLLNVKISISKEII